ncbi:MAG: hypothetical protein AB2A00_22795 [Myxococcota bacterium]
MVRSTGVGVVVAAGVVLALGCNVPPSRCQGDADCLDTNRCEKGYCRPRVLSTRDAGPPRCATNQECLDRHPEAPFICRKSDSLCVPLTTSECDVVLGDNAEIANDNTVFFGSILPIRGVDESTGQPLLNSVELARQDFKQTTSGLPAATPGGTPRPIVFVACNDEDALGAAEHLSNTVQVPAIVGPAFSGVTLDVANNVTVPAGTLVLSPSATSPAITGIQDNGLVWRTSPPDSLQAVAVNALASVFEQQVRTQLGLAQGDQIKLGLAFKGDGYGQGLANELFNILRFNGLSVADNGNNYRQYNYGDPDDNDPVPSYDEKATQIIGFQPHVILLIGTNEAVTEMFTRIENNWPSGLPYRPRYVLTDGGKIPEIIQLTANDATVRNRVLGTVPGTKNANYDRFRLNFTSNESSLPYQGTDPDVFGTAGAYDALYLLAYAAVAVGEPVTGPRLVEGLKRMVGGGTVINAGAAQINDAFTAVAAADGRIDFNGASGPLDFNTDTGEATSDIQVWCVSVSSGSGAFATTDYYYNAATGQMAEYSATPDGLPTCP